MRAGKKTFLLTLLLILIGGALIYVWFSGERESKGKNENARRIIHIKWGPEKDTLTFKARVDDEGANEGPRSFFITASDEIYVLDNVRHRINVYRNGNFVRELLLSARDDPSDIYIANNAIYLVTQFSLEKIALDGTVIRRNDEIRSNEGLIYGAERVLVYHGLVVVTHLGRDSACFGMNDLKTISCGELGRLFRTYNVMDTTDNKIYFISDDGTLQCLEDGSAHPLSHGLKPNNYVNETMYPASTMNRVRQNKLYSMHQEKDGVSFYERSF